MFKIDGMREEDIPALSAIVAENYDAHCAQMFYPDARCAFGDDPWKPRWLVARLDGAPIGCLCWAVDWSSWGNFNICWVQVHPDHQGLGVGKALINSALDEIRPQAGVVLLATTKPEYYRKNWGFLSLMSYRPVYQYDGETEVLMGLDLNA